MTARRGGVIDVLVLGGGVAGLAAARTLDRAGVRVEVVEARDRLGGRILTVHDPGAPIPIELGAEFVHGEPEESWHLIREAVLPALEIEGEYLTVEHGAVCEDGGMMGRMEPVIARLHDDRDPGDRSVADAVAARRAAGEEARRAALRYVEGFHAADPARASARGIARAEGAAGETAGGERTARLASGYGALVRHLSHSLGGRVHLSHVVHRVRWGADGVEVDGTTPLGRPLPTLRARRLVVTLPVGVLRATPGSEGAVEFDPPLAGKRAALALVEPGHVARVALRFRSPFWETLHDGRLARAAFLFADGAEAFPVWWTQYPARTTTLVGWTGGPDALPLLRLEEPARIARAVESLAEMLGLRARDLGTELEAAYSHDWTGDPFSRGAYSWVVVGGAEAPAALAAPVDDVLHFAGEATVADGNIGTVHGAIASGLRAAREILAGW